MSPLRAVLFDLDGTLLDREASLLQFVRGQHERFPALRHIGREDYARRFIELDGRGHRWKDAVYQQLAGEFGITGASPEELLRDYEESFCHHCVPFAALHPMLQVLGERFKLGLVTNGPAEFQERSIEALGLGPYFEAILISGREGLRKPDARLFRRAAERLQVLPGECAYVGDHAEADIAGAQAAGMRAVWKRNALWPAPGHADSVIDSLHELPQALERLAST